MLSSVLMLSNDGSFSFLSLGGKKTRKGEWVGRGQFPSLQQLSYLICHQLILFTLLSSGVNTLTSLNTLQRLFVDPAKSNQEIVNPSVAAVLHTYVFLAFSLSKAKGFVTLYSQDLNVRLWQEWYSDCEYDDL